LNSVQIPKHTEYKKYNKTSKLYYKFDKYNKLYYIYYVYNILYSVYYVYNILSNSCLLKYIEYRTT